MNFQIWHFKKFYCRLSEFSLHSLSVSVLLRYCLLFTTSVMLTHILYLLYLGPGLGLFMFYLCDPFFIFKLFLNTINQITSLKQTHLFFADFLEYLLLLFLDDNVDEER